MAEEQLAHSIAREDVFARDRLATDSRHAGQSKTFIEPFAVRELRIVVGWSRSDCRGGIAPSQPDLVVSGYGRRSVASAAEVAVGSCKQEKHVLALGIDHA